MKQGLATIAAMLNRPRRAVVVALIASSLGLAACGSDDGPEPSIPPDVAAELLEDLERIQANIDADSCIVASTETQTLIADIQALPPDVNEELKQNLEASAERLQTLLSENNDSDPACTDDTDTTTEETTTEEPTTTEETTTEETTTEEATTTEPTTTTPPTTTTTPGGGGSGGVGPAGGGP